nr:MAG TPA: hypothetical protein [Caudoviricetes sp.]
MDADLRQELPGWLRPYALIKYRLNCLQFSKGSSDFSHTM